jgi:hypothetical protein
MVIRTNPFRAPFPRRVLIRIHRDLFLIERQARRSVDRSSGLSLVEQLILVSEDRRFFWHNRIDYLACARELLRAVTIRRVRGASTIDMQFVRMATGYYEGSVTRKGLVRRLTTAGLPERQALRGFQPSGGREAIRDLPATPNAMVSRRRSSSHPSIRLGAS